MSILDTIDTKGSLATVFPSVPTQPPRSTTAPPTPTPIVSNFDIVLSPDKKTLSVTNTSIPLTIYIKLTKGDEILFSDQDKEGTYKKFFFAANPTYPNDVFEDVMTHMGLYDASGRKTPEFQYLFGAVTTAKKDYYDRLKDVIKLEKTEPVKKKFNHADTGDPIKIRKCILLNTFQTSKYRTL